jgi:hypothetical protein
LRRPEISQRLTSSALHSLVNRKAFAFSASVFGPSALHAASRRAGRGAGAGIRGCSDAVTRKAPGGGAVLDELADHGVVDKVVRT